MIYVWALLLCIGQIVDRLNESYHTLLFISALMILRYLDDILKTIKKEDSDD